MLKQARSSGWLLLAMAMALGLAACDTPSSSSQLQNSPNGPVDATTGTPAPGHSAISGY
jgi:putative hemolysin